MVRATRSYLVLLLASLSVGACDDIRDNLPWRQFYAASTSMEPTLPKGTRITGEKVAVANLKRGDILIVHHNDTDWVARLAGVPGDRIALAEGTVMLNGKPVNQRRAGRFTISDSIAAGPAIMLLERFPGERRAHRVLDDGPTPGDNFDEIALGPDEYFVLGDNRDHAADSRHDGGSFGLGVLSGTDIKRRVTLTDD